MWRRRTQTSLHVWSAVSEGGDHTQQNWWAGAAGCQGGADCHEKGPQLPSSRTLPALLHLSRLCLTAGCSRPQTSKYISLVSFQHVNSCLVRQYLPPCAAAGEPQRAAPHQHHVRPPRGARTDLRAAAPRRQRAASRAPVRPGQVLGVPPSGRPPSAQARRSCTRAVARARTVREACTLCFYHTCVAPASRRWFIASCALGPPDCHSLRATLSASQPSAQAGRTWTMDPTLP